MLDTSDRRFLKANLIFALGQGWVLEQIDDLTLSAFDRVKPISSFAKGFVDEAEQRWELTGQGSPERCGDLVTGTVR
jgi:hypothetical protein